MFLEAFKIAESISGRGIRYLAAALHIMAVVCLVLLVAGLAYGAIARYVFHSPVPYTEEVSSLLFVAVSFLGLANIFLKGGHITFGGKGHGDEGRARPLRKITGLAFTAVALGFVLAPTFGFADFSRVLKSESDVAEVLLWPWMALIPLGLSGLLLAIFSQLLTFVIRGLQASHGKRT